MEAKPHRIIEVRMSYTPTALTVFILEAFIAITKIESRLAFFLTNDHRVQFRGFATNW
jgi:hypothetical protein